MENHAKTVEAVLFTAAKPLSIAEIASITGISNEHVRKALRVLIADYKKRDSAIEIARIGRKYVMQLRPSYAEKVQKIAPVRIPKHLVKTIALIAYYQPVTQSALRDTLGPKVYSHIQQLAALGLIKLRKRGRTYVVTTTKKFAEHFEIDVRSREALKKKMHNIISGA